MPNSESRAPKEKRGGATAIRIAQAKASTSLGGTSSQHGPQSEVDEVKSASGAWMLCQKEPQHVNISSHQDASMIRSANNEQNHHGRISLVIYI